MAFWLFLKGSKLVYYEGRLRPSFLWFIMAAIIGQKLHIGFKIVAIWDNNSESLQNNLCNDFKRPEYLLSGMNLENEIDKCQTTVKCHFLLYGFMFSWSCGFSM